VNHACPPQPGPYLVPDTAPEAALGGAQGADAPAVADTGGEVNVSIHPDGPLPGMWEVELEGEVDLEAAPMLRDRLLELADRGAVAVIVDLSKVSFLDSSGLSVLIETAQRIEQHGGALYLEGARGAVRQVLEITALLERYKHPRS
jgi:anti-anti-sigma factor